ncbi:oxidoreductase [Virgibacillus soli]|uniref:Gfo/Idh/MocA family protein n=1 Tax=Lederbergia galactosidilytica TaxID=217031 RepID=UPI0007147AB4|nr:Gfo/Idh/MocA family oxidoreductase [Lederbergia galactosidilytica]KRG12965.1 oxidoreductase [Virgibacillus soli]MBP1916198.1 putative dehydrogenase [Lederbergia galactosidilytica]
MIRFGVIGTNWITDSMIEAALQVEGFQLTAVYSRTEEKAKEFADKYGIGHVFTDTEEMAASDVLDAVYIASPNSFHAKHSLTFLNQGKHVLCEKPIASNPEELEEMIQAATRNQVVLMEALKTTLLPTFKAIQENLHKIGQARRYDASYCKYSSRYDRYREGTVLNAFNPTFSNGSLMDLGVYCLYPLVVLFGEPKSVKANAVMLDSGVDGSGSLLLQYDDFEAVVTHSKIINAYRPSEIQGEEGTIIIDEISTPSKVMIRYRDGREEMLGQALEHPSMYYEVEEFIQLIQNGELESKVNSHKNSMITARIMVEARKQVGLLYPADQR